MKEKEVLVSPPNQLGAENLSVIGLNPWPGHDSSSRIQMFASHLGQHLICKGLTERYCQTGMEAEFGKYTLNVKMPVDGRIIKIIDRHKRTIGQDSITENPQTIVIYEDEATKEVGIITLPKYCSFHQYMGFEYKAQPGLQMLVPGQYVPEGTVFLDSPAVTENGGYMYGMELNMAFMSHPAVSEDGIMISRDVLDRLKFKIYDTRIVEWGSKDFPLNMYGTVDNYKAFPDIGEYVRPDGLLAVLRTHDKHMAVVEQSVYDLMEPDHMFDHAVYAPGGGKIVDIRIHHEDNTNSPTPMGMEKQADKYDRARKVFYKEILAEYFRLKGSRGTSLLLHPDFHRLIVEALAATDESTTQKITKLFRRAPLDDYRLEFVIEYEITPTVGYKLTDCHGGKGVICKIAEPHEMPIDEVGNRADMVMDANSSISRMNYGRLYEHYYNACSRDVVKTLYKMLGSEKGDKQLFGKLTNLFNDDRAGWNKLYDYLLGYYSIVTPRTFKRMSEIPDDRKFNHLLSVMKKALYLYLPTDNEPESMDIVRQLQKYYRPTYGPVSYVGNSGRRVVTKKPVRISSMYIMLLEKIGDAWSAVPSGKLQAFGILSQITKSDKFSQPVRNQAVKAIGETEGRILVSYGGQMLVAELMDRNNNPTTHKEMVMNLINAPIPTNIPSLVDRVKIPYGGAKPIQLVAHIAMCGGWKHVYHSKKPKHNYGNLPLATVPA